MIDTTCAGRAADHVEREVDSARDSNYALRYGEQLMPDNDDKETGFDSSRRLCPDGDCIGVLGPDGRCTECGKQDPGGDNPEPAEPAYETQDDRLALDSNSDAATSEDGPAEFDSKRRLCDDEACIGVIGPDNRCSECGKFASQPDPAPTKDPSSTT